MHSGKGHGVEGEDHHCQDAGAGDRNGPYEKQGTRIEIHNNLPWLSSIIAVLD
jgi:hypothetical protein